MESQVSGSALELAETEEKVLQHSQKANLVAMPEGETGAEETSGKSGPVTAPEDLPGAIERFSHLSSDLTGALLDLWRIFRSSAEQLESVQSSVETQKGELKSLETQIESERRAWEEEKARRMQQEAVYTENLELQRQREAEEYKRVWDLEKAQARQKLEEELRLVQQESKLKQEAFDQDCQQREQALKQKELEWLQLAQELEQFMSRLSRRVKNSYHETHG